LRQGNENPPPLQKGWLMKQGAGVFGGLKKRFFVLNGSGILEYFESDGENDTVGVITLTAQEKVVPDAKKEKLTFRSLEKEYRESSRWLQPTVQTDRLGLMLLMMSFLGFEKHLQVIVIQNVQ